MGSVHEYGTAFCRIINLLNDVFIINCMFAFYIKCVSMWNIINNMKVPNLRSKH